MSSPRGRKRMSRTAVLGAALVVMAAGATPVLSEGRMVVQGNLLIYDTAKGPERGILPSDAVLLGELLMENPDVDTVVVSGRGGFSWPAYEMATKIEAFGLNTVARNTCSSSCTILLLAGRDRSLERGARLGFHRATNAADFLRGVYEDYRDEEGWNDEFAFANHVFEEGQIAARDQIDFMVRRGVSLSFALKTLTYSNSDMWYPS